MDARSTHPPSEQPDIKKNDRPATAGDRRYRVEGIARRGRVVYVKVVGRPGQWHIYGSAGFRLDIQAKTVEDAVRKAGRRLPFKPLAIREI